MIFSGISAVMWVSVCICLCVSTGGDRAYAAHDKDSDNVLVPEGMRVEKVGDVNVVMPQGSALKGNAGFYTIEKPEEYAARKFIEVDERFRKLETEVDHLKKENAELKQTLSELENRSGAQ